MNRKQFLRMSASGIGGMAAFGPSFLSELKSNFNKSDLRMPALFLGHGNPMNALAENDFTRRLNQLGIDLPKPEVIICISAHWLTRGTWVTSSENPETIHDFSGFPDELFKVQYPAPGAPKWAKAIEESVSLTEVKPDANWGLDHGTWSVLKHVYPKANIPVIQFSMDYTKPAEWHFNLAKELRDLRNHGALIVGSGNIVHNLGNFSWDEKAKPFDWALEFDALSKKLMEDRNFDALIHYEKLGEAAKMAIPTNDHYLPLLYSLALADEKEAIQFPYEEIMNGSIAMRCVQIG